ncbi:unnamed protein product, partial [Adineta ricciae]
MHSQQSNTQVACSQPIASTIRISTPPITTTQQQHTIQSNNYNNSSNKRRKKRCSAKRRLRRFNKKCIKQGLTEEQKQKLMDEYNRTNNITLTNSSILNINNNIEEEPMDVTTVNENQIIKRKSNKRKRLSTSVSHQSISRRLSKKIKSTAASTDVIPTETYSKLPKYLRKAPNLLFQNLRLHLKKKINKLTQKRFIYRHLQLLDQQYRLSLHQNLWQSYLNLGSEHQLWANQVYKLTKSKDHQQCQQFVIKRLADLNRQHDQCTIELRIQSSSCPSKLFPLDKLDHDLQEFAHLQQVYLSKKMNCQLMRYNDIIEENKLFNTLSKFNLTNIQKEVIERLENIRQVQMNVVEDLLKLETQVSMEYLPKIYNDLEHYIRSDFYSPIVKNQLAMELKQKQYKTIQEAKRLWLNIYIDMYEIQYQNYEQQYQQELKQFQSINLNA